MPVCVGLIMFGCFFLSFLLIANGVRYICLLIKVDWLAACIGLRVVGAVFVVAPRRWRKICTIRQPTQTRINCEKYTFCVIKSLEHLKNLKTVRVLYLGLEINPSRETVHLNMRRNGRPLYLLDPLFTFRIIMTSLITVFLGL
jgi:hypothetical protein